MLSRLSKRAFFVWVMLCIAVPFIVMYPLFYILLKNKKYHKLGHRLRRFWARLVLAGPMFPVKVYFEEPLVPGKPYIITPNHFSYLDIATVTYAIPGYYNFMGKSELEKMPLFGIFFRTIDISVNRKNPIASAKSLIRAKRQLMEDKYGIVIFVEGTVSKNPPHMGKFKDGPFALAIETGVDILPLSMPDNYLRLPDISKKIATHGPLRIFVHKPISAKGLALKDLETLKQQVFDVMNSKLQPE